MKQKSDAYSNEPGMAVRKTNSKSRKIFWDLLYHIHIVFICIYSGNYSFESKSIQINDTLTFGFSHLKMLMTMMFELTYSGSKLASLVSILKGSVAAGLGGGGRFNQVPGELLHNISHFKFHVSSFTYFLFHIQF